MLCLSIKFVIPDNKLDSENSKERPDFLNTALLSHATLLHLINCLKALGNGSEHIPFQLYCFLIKMY